MVSAEAEANIETHQTAAESDTSECAKRKRLKWQAFVRYQTATSKQNLGGVPGASCGWIQVQDANSIGLRHNEHRNYNCRLGRLGISHTIPRLLKMGPKRAPRENSKLQQQPTQAPPWPRPARRAQRAIRMHDEIHRSAVPKIELTTQVFPFSEAEQHALIRTVTPQGCRATGNPL